MDIGDKLRTARAASGMTQEQVAEALGVSRQTVSNWENNRTYPDIVSVIRMSDLYAVSLDILLKEEKVMADNKTTYTDYLAESTDTVRRGNSLEKVIEIGSYLVVWGLFLLLALCCFHPDLYETPEIPHRFRTIAFFFALPAATLIISVLIGASSGWGKRKWWMTVFFGGMFVLMQFSVAGSVHMIGGFAAGAAVSCIGIAAGQYFSRRTKAKKK